MPQGSILGPLLFTLFMNDLPFAVSDGVTLYADDTTVLVTGDNRKGLLGGCERVLTGFQETDSKFHQN